MARQRRWRWALPILFSLCAALLVAIQFRAMHRRAVSPFDFPWAYARAVPIILLALWSSLAHHWGQARLAQIPSQLSDLEAAEAVGHTQRAQRKLVVMGLAAMVIGVVGLETVTSPYSYKTAFRKPARIPPVLAAATRVVATGNGSYLVTVPINLEAVAGVTAGRLWCEGLLPCNAGFTPSTPYNSRWEVTLMSPLPKGRIPGKLDLEFQIYSFPVCSQTPKGTLDFGLIILGIRDAGFRARGNVDNLPCRYEVDLSKAVPIS